MMAFIIIIIVNDLGNVSILASVLPIIFACYFFGRVMLVLEADIPHFVNHSPT